MARPLRGLLAAAGSARQVLSNKKRASHELIEVDWLFIKTLAATDPFWDSTEACVSRRAVLFVSAAHLLEKTLWISSHASTREPPNRCQTFAGRRIEVNDSRKRVRLRQEAKSGFNEGVRLMDTSV